MRIKNDFISRHPTNIRFDQNTWHGYTFNNSKCFLQVSKTVSFLLFRQIQAFNRFMFNDVIRSILEREKKWFRNWIEKERETQNDGN